MDASGDGHARGVQRGGENRPFSDRPKIGLYQALRYTRLYFLYDLPAFHVCEMEDQAVNFGDVDVARMR